MENRDNLTLDDFENNQKCLKRSEQHEEKFNQLKSELDNEKEDNISTKNELEKKDLRLSQSKNDKMKNPEIQAKSASVSNTPHRSGDVVVCASASPSRSSKTGKKYEHKDSFGMYENAWKIINKYLIKRPEYQKKCFIVS